MEKRVLLAVGLSVAVLIGFNILNPPVKRPTPAATSAPGAAAGTAPAAGATAAATEVERSVAPAIPAPAAPAAQTLVGDTTERQIVVENEAVRATFSTRGGVLTSWLLKNYAEKGAPLELVPASAPPGSTKPFTLITDDAGVNAALAQALFKPSATSLDAKAAPATLTLEFSDASGLSARKEFSFSPQKPYEVTL